MAKTAGSIRASKWENDLYHLNGVRMRYEDLPEARKRLIRSVKNETEREMWRNLKDKKVVMQTSDYGAITIKFVRKGIEHVANDAMMTLSGLYLSRKSMIHLDKVLKEAEYIKTNHKKIKGRKDDKDLWFRFVDRKRGNLYFKVSYNSKSQDKYTLHSVVDKPPKDG